jgi:hypothetical protein
MLIKAKILVLSYTLYMLNLTLKVQSGKKRTT